MLFAMFLSAVLGQFYGKVPGYLCIYGAQLQTLMAVHRVYIILFFLNSQSPMTYGARVSLSRRTLYS